MKIIKTSKYKKDLQKKIINKHMKKEENIIIRVEYLLRQSSNMKEVILSPSAILYNITKKKRKSKRNIYSQT